MPTVLASDESAQRPLAFPVSRDNSVAAVTAKADELTGIAATLEIPIEHGEPVRAYCTREWTPGPRCGQGTHRFQVAWGFDYGRQLEPVGPSFADPKDACGLAALVNARAVRPPLVAEPPPTCAVCGSELPAGSRRHRQVCSNRCRVERFRARRSASGRPPRRVVTTRRAKRRSARKRYTARRGRSD